MSASATLVIVPVRPTDTPAVMTGARPPRRRLRAQLRADGRVDTEWLGGDSEHPDIDRWAREAVSRLHGLAPAAEL